MPRYREEASHDWTGDSVRTIATPSAFAKSSLYYVQEAGKFRTMPAYYTKRENLDSYLVVYTMGGSGELTYGDKTYPLTEGSLFFIDCRKYQYYRNAPGESWELVWVHFSGSSSPAYYERYASAGSPVVPLPAESRIPVVLEEIVALSGSRTFRNELSESRLLVDLLTELLLAVHRRDSASAPGLPSWIRDVMKHYDRHYGDKLSLDDVSSAFSVDKYHLSKEFKRHTGFSPNEYLINARITRAKELLRFTDLPVSEISAGVGVENVSHFIQLFREREAVTPLAYRKSWRQEE